MVRVTVSGSFRRHMGAISSAVSEISACGARTLSPADPRVVSALGEFLFVASDRVRSVRLVQDRHLECIRASHFLWLVSPDGYVGQSAAMEIGFAAAHRIPIFSLTRPADLTLQQYVRQVPSLRYAVEIAASDSNAQPEGLLIDPHASVEKAHAVLERIGGGLAGGDSTAEVLSLRRWISDSFGLQS